MTDAPGRPAAPPAAARRFVLVAVSLAAVLIVAAGALLLYAMGQNRAGNPLAGVIGGPFHLVDQNGRPYTEANLNGKWHFVFFGYTHCPDTCPTTLNDLSLALDKLGKKREAVGIVFISVDPERDTPAVLKSYVESFDAPIVALTGSADEVKEAAHDYRVYYAKHALPGGDYEMDHSAVIYLMDPQGRLAATFTPDAAADAIAAKLQKLVS